MTSPRARPNLIVRTWATHDGRSRQLRHLTYHVETISGKVFSGSSMFKTVDMAVKYEQARIAMRGE